MAEIFFSFFFFFLLSSDKKFDEINTPSCQSLRFDSFIRNLNNNNHGTRNNFGSSLSLTTAICRQTIDIVWTIFHFVLKQIVHFAITEVWKAGMYFIANFHDSLLCFFSLSIVKDNNILISCKSLVCKSINTVFRCTYKLIKNMKFIFPYRWLFLFEIMENG